MDELILANARKSINEIAEITSLKPAAIAERLDRLLEEKDHLSARQEEKLLLIELGDLIRDGKEQLANAESKDYAGIMRTLVAGMTLMANRFDMRKKLVDEEISKISASNAKLFGRVFDIALRHLRDGLHKIYDDLDDDVVDALIEDGLEKARNELEKSVM